MRAVIQRVKKARVTVDGAETGSIGKGILVFIGIGREDNDRDIEYIAGKVPGVRIFPKGDQEASISVLDAGGEIMVISQFTLYGDLRKGKRPSFTGAMEPGRAKEMFERLLSSMRQNGLDVKTGVFQAMMDVELINDGPYTVLIDSAKSF
ncbi:MAG: D-tyrosyl-tRNA(Tyr) deacylase [Spirochaetes bacterium GWF1_51_8]|nr:MAG: D-tyrosyl-tRNA(Tyr) deacylase [Spirochaetes bacterium GWF1_51_8]